MNNAFVMQIAQFADGSQLSLPQTLLILAVILAIADIFVQSDIATHIAYVFVSLAIVIWTPVHPLFRVIIGLLAYAALVYLHYSLWREFVSSWVNKTIAPTKYRSGVRGLIGQQAVIKEIEGKQMVSCQGDLWNFESVEELRDGTQVEITGERGGILFVEPIEKES